MHSWLPEQSEGRLRGFQLRVNLPAAQKLGPPAYREYSPEQIPHVRIAANSSVRVIAGEFVYDGESTREPVATGGPS